MNRAGPAAAAGAAPGPPRTEARHPGSTDVDLLPSIALLSLINDEDATVAGAVREALPALAVAVDLAVDTLRAGGRVHYFGAGTSGRLGVLDVAELGPTYGLPEGRFVAHCAGGPAALVHAAQQAEDDAIAGRRAAQRSVSDADVVLGLSASGTTPYVAGALRAASRAGAVTVLVTADPAAPLAAEVTLLVAADTGPEVIAGSTRMKAGTALKQMLTAFSTAVMVRTGRTYSNLMVEMGGGNAKLRRRSVALLAEATGLSEPDSARTLDACRGELKTALVSVLGGVGAAQARTVLDAVGGQVRAALDSLA